MDKNNYKFANTDYSFYKEPGQQVPQQVPQQFNINSNEPASTMAVVALVLGILSYIGFSIMTGIPAWIIGQIELAKIKRGESSIQGKGYALTGMWLGIVSVILAVLLIIFLIIFFTILFNTKTTHELWS